jgi:hypothetical protein
MDLKDVPKIIKEAEETIKKLEEAAAFAETADKKEILNREIALIKEQVDRVKKLILSDKS